MMSSRFVVIPAAACSCEQMGHVVDQLRDGDRLVISWNGPPSTHGCADRWRSNPSVLWTETSQRIGAAGARNRGVDLVASLHQSDTRTVVAFVDGDDIAAPTWLDELTEPLQDQRNAIVAGSLLLERADGTTDVVAPAIDYWHKQALFGGNFATTIGVYQSLDGMDTRFGCCEDTDLAWRAGAAGIEVVVNDALVTYKGRSLRAQAKQRFLWGYWAVVLIRSHGLSPAAHLPRLKQLYSHKSSVGMFGTLGVDVLSQWLGQSVARLARISL